MKELLQVRVPKDLKKKFKESAEKRGLTINSLAIMVIEEYLKEREEK